LESSGYLLSIMQKNKAQISIEKEQTQVDKLST